MFLLFRVIGGICKGNVSLCTAIVADLPSLKARNRGMVGIRLTVADYRNVSLIVLYYLKYVLRVSH